ncbi:hypothetical protein MTR_8g075300 [Medicago truncatula]|uniref:Uncharacterized protein n=1 Tax=Medicago truncatula TaxID=3880 RepID=G7LB80_MEDTR|nr:hypothetical protein MTR_8g075300 [Medicago truncatula]
MQELKIEVKRPIKELTVAYCPANKQVAYVLTKALKTDQFARLRRELGVVSFLL